MRNTSDSGPQTVRGARPCGIPRSLAAAGCIRSFAGLDIGRQRALPAYRARGNRGMRLYGAEGRGDNLSPNVGDGSYDRRPVSRVYRTPCDTLRSLLAIGRGAGSYDNRRSVSLSWRQTPPTTSWRGSDGFGST